MGRTETEARRGVKAGEGQKEKAGVDVVHSEEGRTLLDLHESIPPSSSHSYETGFKPWMTMMHYRICFVCIKSDSSGQLHGFLTRNVRQGGRLLEASILTESGSREPFPQLPC